MTRATKGLPVAVATALAVLGCLGASVVAGQSKMIDLRQKQPQKPKCIRSAPRLDGNFTQVLVYEMAGVKATYTTRGRVTWVEESDDGLTALPNSAVARDGVVGSKSWTDFHAKAKCPVQTYRLSAGELSVESVTHMDTSLVTCDGKGTVPYDAIASLGDWSALYIADGAYLLTMGSPDVRLGVDEIKGECVSKLTGDKFAFEPIGRQRDPNLIYILDRRGPIRYGVHGEINPAIPAPGRTKVIARWDFADAAPNR